MNKLKQDPDAKAKLKKKKKKKNNINKHKRNCEPVNVSADLVAALTALRLDGKPKKKVKSKKKSKKVKAKPVAQEQIAGTSDQPTPQQKPEHCAWNLDCSHITTTYNGPSM
ncbi:bromodomain-containing protein 4-like [Spodoptera frugiperda]|uniref:Bromodomain-containing protein 4-like n=1 Tax=Spodoptera frugiperda TaxID=7108 RepID=A0A9R0E650_SPOFR|nr:bromodomain-containing protein 4-like [Spodoptera frugiperda]